MARAWITDRWTRSPIDPTTKEPRDPKTAVYGKGARWRVDWYEEQNDGGRKQRAKSFRTKPLAEDFLASVEHDIRSGTYQRPEDGRRTVRDVAGLWLSSKRRLKASTARAYANDLRIWIYPTWGAKKLATITRNDVEQWLTALLDGTADRDYAPDYTTDRGRLSPSRVRRLHAVLAASFAYAVDHGWMRSNPARGVELPRIVDTDQVFLSIDELEALANAATTPTDRGLILFMGYGGIRIGEGAALTVADLDLQARRATIRATVTDGPDGKPTLGPPKNGKSRTVGVPRFLVKELSALTANAAPSDPVFRTKTGVRINLHNWRSRPWSDAVEGAGLGDLGLTPHKLRHTAASLAIAAGADVKVIQNMLGHADATETLNTYGHLWPDRLDEVTERIETARRKAMKSKAS